MAVLSLPRRRLLLGASAAAGLFRPLPAAAGTLGMNPIALEIGPGRRMATIEVTNRGGAATAVQIRVFAWSQEGDADRLAETSDLAISPPIFDIKADEDQVLRLMLRRPADRLERAYRVILDEIPPPGRARQIVVALRISMPVIVAGTVPATPDLQWQAGRGSDGRIVLMARNVGQRHIRVDLLEAVLPQARAPLVARAVGSTPMVLPGAERHWRLDVPGGAPRGGSLRLRVHSGGSGPSEHDLVLSS
jgi:fimbrial chaperone protein